MPDNSGRPSMTIVDLLMVSPMSKVNDKRLPYRARLQRPDTHFRWP